MTPEQRAKNAQRWMVEENERVAERQKKLDAAISSHGPGSDILLPSNQQNSYQGEEAARRKNFDQKKYLFPESFNALRRELQTNWKHLFEDINPDTGTSLAYCMVYDAPQFVGTLNGALDLAVQFDSANIDAICKTFLNELRKKRGAKPFSD